MNGFIKSFLPLLKRFKKYLVEVILLFVALIITMTAFIIYNINQENTAQKIVINDQPQTSSGKIFVDVSGSVKSPDLYQIAFGARLKDAIDKAGGLSQEVDWLFFSRNFNLARILTDQEKIYVPSITEINDGIFIQNQKTLDYTMPTNTAIVNNASTEDNDQIISINSATVEELDQLPGVGQVTADKIITNRPYTTIEELINKKVVNKNVFEKIKSLIRL